MSSGKVELEETSRVPLRPKCKTPTATASPLDWRRVLAPGVSDRLHIQVKEGTEG